MSKLHLVADVGTSIRNAFFETLLSDKRTVDRVLACMGKPDAFSADLTIVGQATLLLTEVLSNFAAPRPELTTNLTCVNTVLLDHWPLATRDPDELPTLWLRQGAPAGLISSVESRNIFPVYGPEEDTVEISAANLRTEAEFTNYAGVEGTQEVGDELERLRSEGFVQVFDSLDDAERYAGGTIVLSRIGLIMRERAGKIKTRLVVDSKRSGISKATRKWERVALPRITDVLDDLMALPSPTFKCFSNGPSPTLQTHSSSCL